MTSLDHTDVDLLVKYVRKHSPEPPAHKPGYFHMGALIADLAFQRRASYKNVVLPKVAKLRQAVKDDKPTTTDLVAWLQSATEEVRRSIYKSPSKWQVIDDVAALFSAEGLNTVEDARAAFYKRPGDAPESERRVDLRRKLIGINNVGPKTRDYVDILLGSDDGCAIDFRVRNAFGMAGIKQPKYEDGIALIHETAAELGWTPQEVDSALWTAGDKNA